MQSGEKQCCFSSLKNSDQNTCNIDQLDLILNDGKKEILRLNIL